MKGGLRLEANEDRIREQHSQNRFKYIILM